jgi:hypothetical protein
MMRHLRSVPPAPAPPVVVVVRWATRSHCPVCAGRGLRLTRVVSGRASGPVACPLCSTGVPIPAVLGIPFRSDPKDVA